MSDGRRAGRRGSGPEPDPYRRTIVVVGVVLALLAFALMGYALWSEGIPTDTGGDDANETDGVVERNDTQPTEDASDDGGSGEGADETDENETDEPSDTSDEGEGGNESDENTEPEPPADGPTGNETNGTENDETEANDTETNETGVEANETGF